MNTKKLLLSCLLLLNYYTLPVTTSIGNVCIQLKNVNEPDVHYFIKDSHPTSAKLGLFFNLVSHGFLAYQQMQRPKLSFLQITKEHAQLFTYNAILSLGATIAHELAHAYTNYNEKEACVTFVYSKLGTLAHAYEGYTATNYMKNNIAALMGAASGPFAGALWTLFCYNRASCITNLSTQALKTFAAVKALDHIAQLIPIEGSDGSNVLHIVRQLRNQKRS